MIDPLYSAVATNKNKVIYNLLNFQTTDYDVPYLGEISNILSFLNLATWRDEEGFSTVCWGGGLIN